MKDKIYAVLCAGCAERWEEWYNMHEFTDRPQERRQCRTCLQVGVFSEYALTRKDIPLTTRDASPYRRGRKRRDNPSVGCAGSSAKGISARDQTKDLDAYLPLHKEA